MPDDGTTTIPIEGEMPQGQPMDLPNGVGTLMITETTGNIQNTNREGRDNAAQASALSRFVAVRNFDEVGTIEGRAVSGVNATPIASPAVQQT